LGLVRVVVRQHEARKQQKEADRSESVVHDRRKRAKPLWIGEVEENDVQRGEGAQSRERRETLLLRLDQDWPGSRSFLRRSPRLGGPRYDLHLGAQNRSPVESCGPGLKREPCFGAGLVLCTTDGRRSADRFRRSPVSRPSPRKRRGGYCPAGSD